MTYEEAVLYILKEAAPHGRTHECLYEFVAAANRWIGRSDKINWKSLADQALQEWDI